MSAANELPKFLPVIFANGEDDDLPGLVQAGANAAVIYGDKVYEPGEDITFVGRKIRLCANHVHWIEEDGSLIMCLMGPGEPVRIVASDKRLVSFIDVDFMVGK